MPTHKSVLQASIRDPADHSDDTLAAIVKRFSEIEHFTSPKPSLLPEDLRSEQLFTENCTRLGNGQYSVRLLSTSVFESLGDSYCVRVSYPDDFLQCMVWRESSTEEFSVLKLNTVT